MPPLRLEKAEGRAAFNAAEFRRLTSPSVSDAEITKLQEIYKEDLNLAVDKYLEYDKEALRPKSTITAPETGPKMDTGLANPDYVQFEPEDYICERDHFWDKAQRRYKLKPRTVARSEDFNKFVLFVRRMYDEKMNFSHTVIVVKGEQIRRALRGIFRNAGGFSLTDDADAELQNNKFLYWARPELCLLERHFKLIGDTRSLREISATLFFIKKEWNFTDVVLQTLLPTSIDFDLLWTIFPPDCLIVGKDKLGVHNMWRARSHMYRTQQDDSSRFFLLVAEYVDWNGTSLGITQKDLLIAQFDGTVGIEDLAFLPLKYHPARDTIVSGVMARSEKKLGFSTKGFLLQECDGLGLCKADKEEGLRHSSPYSRYMTDRVLMALEAEQQLGTKHFSGRAMIDPTMMIQLSGRHGMVSTTVKGRSLPRVCISELADSKDSCKATVDQLLQYMGSAKHLGLAQSNHATSGHESVVHRHLYPENMTAEEKLICSPLVYGYSFSSSTWGAFLVDNLSDVGWNDTLLESLVMEQSLRSTIYGLIKTHSAGSSNFDDFVKGKGKGLIGLLHGPPGTGKTLTAEAIAETARMPLYAVSSGVLGYEADTIYKKLLQILHLATHWKAVLLLDEADVFLAKRSMGDLKQNAIVSVFLRELEYYEGILLLTTNQMNNIDEAFQSRIHFCHQYLSLDCNARKKVWSSFLQEARTRNTITVDVDDKGIEELASVTLNGRQIKNAMSIAIRLATVEASGNPDGPSPSSTKRLTVVSIMDALKSLLMFQIQKVEGGDTGGEAVYKKPPANADVGNAQRSPKTKRLSTTAPHAPRAKTDGVLTMTRKQPWNVPRS